MENKSTETCEAHVFFRWKTVPLATWATLRPGMDTSHVWPLFSGLHDIHSPTCRCRPRGFGCFGYKLMLDRSIGYANTKNLSSKSPRHITSTFIGRSRSFASQLSFRFSIRTWFAESLNPETCFMRGLLYIQSDCWTCNKEQQRPERPPNIFEPVSFRVEQPVKRNGLWA